MRSRLDKLNSAEEENISDTEWGETVTTNSQSAVGTNNNREISTWAVHAQFSHCEAIKVCKALLQFSLVEMNDPDPCYHYSSVLSSKKLVIYESCNVYYTWISSLNSQSPHHKLNVVISSLNLQPSLTTSYYVLFNTFNFLNAIVRSNRVPTNSYSEVGQISQNRTNLWGLGKFPFPDIEILQEISSPNWFFKYEFHPPPQK